MRLDTVPQQINVYSVTSRGTSRRKVALQGTIHDRLLILMTDRNGEKKKGRRATRVLGM